MSLILIVEDEEAMLDIFAETVEEMGHQPLRARDGAEALMLARTHSPSLVISDYMMPRVSGLDLLRALREDPHLRIVPFILLSAALPKGREEANTFMSKPIDLDEFEGAIDHALKTWPVDRPAPAQTNEAVPRAASTNGVLRDEILNWVAHELKTPLSSTRLNAQILLRKLEQKELDVSQKYAESIVRQVDRMSGLVTSILDAARLGDGKVVLQRRSTDLPAFVGEVVREWRELQPDVDFVLRLDAEGVVATIDPDRVRHILNNLISNAVKYGGDARKVGVRLVESPGLATVEVRDWGIGIPAADVPYVFERFHRVESAEGGGHGLGLFIASALARLHGGSLAVKSAIGQGSTFSLRLPIGR